MSRARVAPVKYVTIPKLETLAALMGCRLAETVSAELKINITKRYFWTDSKTVLNWINSNKRLQTFEANRIGEICEKSETNEWNWVPTTENIADIMTRDNSFNKKLDEWLSGPEFLMKDKTHWPKQETYQDDEITMAVMENTQPLTEMLKRVSRFRKVIRITAWVYRFVSNIRTTEKGHSDLSVAEMEKAKIFWYKVIQNECYSDDIKHLQNGTTSAKLRLTKCSVYFDDTGVMRLVGRIERAKDVSICAKNPIILDGNHRLTEMLIKELHLAANHTGMQVLVHEFRSTYWMPKMTSRIKRVISQCVWCRRRNVKVEQPVMGLLPNERFLTHKRPFTATGIDYFGPFYTRDGRGTSGRYSKIFRTRYGVMFTCLTTRAIHVEIANSLSTDSCIMAIRRMMARRGQIETLVSDNGTNFRGAATELRKALDELDVEAAKSSLAIHGINWQFIPANAPNFGGCWERLIGCFKRTIESILCVDRNPTDEILNTIFCEAEHLVNSRPYLLESDDPGDDIGFCPNNILIQQNTAIYSPGIFSEYDTKRKRMWRISQLLIDGFWKRFIKEYIPTLMNRSKWHKVTVNLEEGEIVVIKDNNLPRGDWPLGIVTRVFPGKDNVVRVAEVRTIKNTYRRPVNRLCRLQVHRRDNDRAGE